MADSHIIKRKGQGQAYDERKVYASVYYASLNAHLGKLDAEKIAEKVSRDISAWVASGKDEISSEKIFQKATELLKPQNKDAAFMYETHRDLS